MKFIIFGPQGSGKGTQAELIASRHNLPYISTGDIFRYHLKNQTDLGAKVVEYINDGNLVPDELTNEIIKDRIMQPDCEIGFVLDGYPRNKKQQEYLTGITAIDFAIVIELNDEEAIKRLTDRLACKCGLSYHLEFNPSKVKNVCDKCGGQLFKRDDDKPEAIKQRLSLYHSETEPIFDFYDHQSKLFKVDGAKTIEDVYKEINKIISK